MIALLCALRYEWSGLARPLDVDRRTLVPTENIYPGGKELLLVETGMGQDCARRATESVLTRYPLSAIISFGYGGALTPGLKVGDLVIGEKLALQSDPGGPVYTSDPSLVASALQAAGDCALEIAAGKVLTTGGLVDHPGERQALADRFQADVADMESYYIAGIAGEYNKPFLSLRAISDTTDQTMPPFDRFYNTTDGAWLVKAALRYFLSSPGDLAKIPLIYTQSRRASSSLGKFLPALIHRISTDEPGD